MRLLESAESGLTAADMALHAVVARRRRGELMGGETGRALVAGGGRLDDGHAGAGPMARLAQSSCVGMA